GSKSDRWVQLCADILGQRFVRPAVAEAGALGAAIIAGVGSGLYPSFEGGVEAMVRLEREFEPDLQQHERYAEWYELYKQLWPTTSELLRALAARQGRSPA
ncbi:MAG: FGGY-family carbohydrate kinase, partial [Anaerolineae bacterium]